LDALKDAKAKLEGELLTAQTEIGTLTTDRDKYKADAEKFGKQPGAMGTTAVKKEGDKSDEEKPASSSIHPASSTQTEINNNY
jgi:hypothetical protein